jgi:hypothetical protein
MLKRKGEELEDKQKQLDERQAALRTLAIDLAFLRKNHQKLVEDNEKFDKAIRNIQNVDEIHIEIDILSLSN